MSIYSSNEMSIIAARQRCLSILLLPEENKLKSKIRDMSNEEIEDILNEAETGFLRHSIEE